MLVYVRLCSFCVIVLTLAYIISRGILPFPFSVTYLSPYLLLFLTDSVAKYILSCWYAADSTVPSDLIINSQATVAWVPLFGAL